VLRARLLEAWSAGRFDLLVSPRVLDELADVLGRAKFRRYLSAERARIFAEAVGREGVLVDDPAEVPAVTRDPKDDYLVALARAAGADVIVSGARHLRGLVDPDPPALTPREFAARLQPE
jgi:putative PIN family toxin of toxin-antitoxin system